MSGGESEHFWPGVRGNMILGDFWRILAPCPNKFLGLVRRSVSVRTIFAGPPKLVSEHFFRSSQPTSPPMYIQGSCCSAVSKPLKSHARGGPVTSLLNGYREDLGQIMALRLHQRWLLRSNDLSLNSITRQTDCFASSVRTYQLQLAVRLNRTQLNWSVGSRSTRPLYTNLVCHHQRPPGLAESLLLPRVFTGTFSLAFNVFQHDITAAYRSREWSVSFFSFMRGLS